MVNWAAAITTCPRDESLLLPTVLALRRGGWGDVTVYGEPGSDTLDGVKCVTRPVAYGCWVNWVCSLFEMLQANDKADYFAIFEDDISICNNVRSYLEELMPGLGRFGAIALYTPSHMKKLSGGLHCLHDESYRGGTMWGTQAIVFTAESLSEFLSHRDTVTYRRESLGRENKNRDSAIGMWARASGRKVYYHTPSLVQHVGRISSVQHAHHEADDYVGDDFDAVSLLGGRALIAPSRDKITMI